MSANMDWSQFEPVNRETEKTDWSQFEPVEDDKKSQYEKDKALIWEDSGDIERQQERGTAQATSRFIESSLGTLGDIQSGIKGLTGLQLGTQLPTTSKLQEFSEKATLGYTKPQNEFEQKTGDILQDISKMALPGASSYTMLRTIGIPVAGFLAKEGIENVGGSEGSANLAKLGTMLALDLTSAYKNVGQGGAKKYAQKLWQDAEKEIPEGVKISSKNISSSMEALEKNLISGGSSPKTKKALEKIKEIKKSAKSGKIEVKELMDFRKRINDWIDANKGFSWDRGEAAVKKGTIDNLNQVKSKVIDALDEYSAINPAFGDPYKKSNEAYAVYHASNNIKGWLKDKFGNYLTNPYLGHLFGFSTKAAVGGLGATGIYQAGKLLYRVQKSPTLSELYGNVIQAAIKNDAPAAAMNLQKLKEELSIQETSQSNDKK